MEIRRLRWDEWDYTAKDALSPQLAVLNSKLYATWSEADNGGFREIRAAVYNGLDSVPGWKFVDGDSPTMGLNKNPAKDAVVGNSLYSAWHEGLGVPFFEDQIRLATYNGNDNSPAWQFADANGSVGLNKDPSKNAAAVQLAVLNSRLYSVWQEENANDRSQIRVATLQ